MKLENGRKLCIYCKTKPAQKKRTSCARCRKTFEAPARLQRLSNEQIKCKRHPHRTVKPSAWIKGQQQCSTCYDGGNETHRFRTLSYRTAKRIRENKF